MNLGSLAKMMDGFDPSMFQQLGAVLKDSADRIRAMDERLQRIEAKLDQLTVMAEPESEIEDIQGYNGALHG